MRSEGINSENVDNVGWDDAYFKFCDFEGFLGRWTGLLQIL